MNSFRINKALQMALLPLWLLFHMNGFAQQTDVNTEQQVINRLTGDGKIWVVIVVASMVFVGLACYLFWIDLRTRKMEKWMRNKYNEE